MIRKAELEFGVGRVIVDKVEHFFRHRINNSVLHASEYLKQFPSPIISIIAKFISFISGGFAAVLIIIAFLDESLLEDHVFGRNLFWYAAVFGTITAISRAAVTDELLVLDPEGAMSLVVQHTHYMPKRWRGKENTEMVRMKFETLFQYTAMMWLEEMASIFLTPYLLIFIVPKRVDEILDFITEYTVNIEGVGDVCSFSAFEFQRHGNANYASPYNAPRMQRSSQGKMEKSFLSFQTCYPFWRPNAEGMQLLTTLRAFRDQKLQWPVSGYPHSPYARWPRSPRVREQNTRNSSFRRDPVQNSPGSGCHLGSCWLIETDPKAHPYLLDWFYISRPHHVSDPNVEPPHVALDIDNENLDFWVPSRHEEASQGESWPNIFENRSVSHLEASTSSPVFQEQSVPRHHDSSSMMPPGKSHWWARGGPGGSGGPRHGSFLEPPRFGTDNESPHASFLESPDYSHRNVALGDNHDESHSQKSIDEVEQEHLDWRNYQNLSRSTYTKDLAGRGEFKLHFVDIF